MKLRKITKVLLIVISIFFILAALIIIFISPITKYLVEKYDEKYTGRQIEMDWAYVNPFTGYIHFNNLKIYEFKSDSVFLSASGLSANFAMRKLFSKTYEISELVLDAPKGTIIQKGNKHDLNFNDLIERFSSNDTDTLKPLVHFSVLDIKINEGEIRYYENVIPINYFIKKVNIESSGVRWDSDSIAANFSFLSGIGNGDMKGNIIINSKNLNYQLTAVIHKFDLNFLAQYLKDLSNYGSFTANLDADINAEGNFNHARNLNAKGKLVINDFHFGKNPKEDYASFSKFILDVIDLNPENRKYIFDSVILNRPFFKYEQYDHLDNIETMFGKGGANVRSVHENTEHFNLILEIADYVKELARDFFQSYYKINRLQVNEGNFKYNDYSLSEKFTIEANPLTVQADSIDKNRKRVQIYSKAGIKPYGNAAVNLSINPKDSGDFDLYSHLEKLSLAMFNPYLISYTSFPLNRGTMEFNGIWHVRNGNIQSENHLIVIDPRVARRLKNKDAKWIPVPLIMAFIRERSNVIDYEIPITGNLNKPKFHLKNVIIDLVENILIKPPTIPYMVHVKKTEKKIEKSLTLKWEMNQSTLRPSQEKFVQKIARFLKEKPEISISVSPMQYVEKEKEYILFYEAKKKYFLLSNKRKPQLFTKEDSLFVLKMSVKDSSFVRYLNNHLNTDLVFTVQEKCIRFIGNDLINKKFNQLVKQREDMFRFYFKENDVLNQIKIHTYKDDVPFNGFSYFKINYNGDIPEALIKAYEELEKVNEESPRDKYFNLRKKIEGRF